MFISRQVRGNLLTWLSELVYGCIFLLLFIYSSLIAQSYGFISLDFLRFPQITVFW